MPTYTVLSTAGTIGPGQRPKLAELITDLHHEVTSAPRYLVQVIFNDLAPGELFLAGQEVSQDHVWIRADIRSGRTEQQKTGLLKQLTARGAETLGIPAAHLWVYVNEIPGANMTEYGQLLPEPGGEAEWFSSLPPQVRDVLTGL